MAEVFLTERYDFRIWPNALICRIAIGWISIGLILKPSGSILTRARSGLVGPPPVCPTAPTTRQTSPLGLKPHSTLLEFWFFYSARSFFIYLTNLCIFLPNSAIQGIRPFRHSATSVIWPIRIRTLPLLPHMTLNQLLWCNG